MNRRTAKMTPTADSVLNICKILKANAETNIASWPIFITCSSLLAQHFHPIILVTLSNPFRPPLFILYDGFLKLMPISKVFFNFQTFIEIRPKDLSKSAYTVS